MIIEMRAPSTRDSRQRSLAKQAVRALLAEERRHMTEGLPPAARADWRLVLTMYEAELDGRALTPGEAAEAAGVSLETAAAFVEGMEADGLLERGEQGTLRLTRSACEHVSLWVDAFSPLPDVSPYRAAAGAPPREPPPEPPA